MPRPKKVRQQTIEATLGRTPIKKNVKPKPVHPGGSNATSSPAKSSPLIKKDEAVPRRTTRSSGNPIVTDFFSPSGKGRVKQPIVVEDSSSSSEEVELNKKGGKKVGFGVAPDIFSPRGVGRGKGKRKAVEADSDSDETEESKRSKGKRKAVEEDSDSDEVEETEVKAREEDDEEEDDDEEDDMPIKRSLPLRESPKKGKQVASSSKPRQVTKSSDSDDEQVVMPLSAPRSSRKRPIVLDESDEELLVSSPVKKRRLIRRGESSPVKQATSEEEEPVRSSAPVKQRVRKPRTEKEKAMELLRRKRAGENIDELEESSEEEVEERKGLYDSDSDVIALREFEDDDEGIPGESSEGATAKSKKKDKKDNKKKKAPKRGVGSEDDSSVASGGEEDLDDFVVADEDGPLGMPTAMLDIPLQFTQHSHKPLRDHFRDVVEWLVQNVINPGFADKHHDLYRLAWQKLDDEVGGLASSKFVSSVWRANFVLALRSRPDMESIEEAKDLIPRNCDVCGRSGHPASYRIRFFGSPYYKSFNSPRFLEPVEVDSSSDSNNGEEGDVDENGSVVPPESTQWYAGVVCHDNALTAHTLIHWKMSLMNFVGVQLEVSGQMTPEKMAKRAKMTPKKRAKRVDRIVGKWEDEGVIKAMFQEFKNTVQKARDQPVTGRRGRAR